MFINKKCLNLRKKSFVIPTAPENKTKGQEQEPKKPSRKSASSK